MPSPPDLSLVTGATGLVGSAVVRALLHGGRRVRVLARPNSNRRNLADLAVEIAEGSLEDALSRAPWRDADLFITWRQIIGSGFPTRRRCFAPMCRGRAIC